MLDPQHSLDETAPDPADLLCYRLADDAPLLRAGIAERGWMDATGQRFAYRCLPLTIANAFGWELVNRYAFEAEWNGGPTPDDLVIRADATEPGADIERFAASHFGHGVVTFFAHYLFRTPPGIGVWARGAPNWPKDGLSPLDGVIETDWLDFAFTMNWIFTRPGVVRFAAGEPFCFVTPLAYRALDGVTPRIVPIESRPEQAAAYDRFSEERTAFNEGLAAGDPETLRRRWQKWYFSGKHPSGADGNPLHLHKLRLAEPVEEPRTTSLEKGAQDV